MDTKEERTTSTASTKKENMKYKDRNGQENRRVESSKAGRNNGDCFVQLPFI